MQILPLYEREGRRQGWIGKVVEYSVVLRKFRQSLCLSWAKGPHLGSLCLSKRSCLLSLLYLIIAREQLVKARAQLAQWWTQRAVAGSPGQ